MSSRTSSPRPRRERGSRRSARLRSEGQISADNIAMTWFLKPEREWAGGKGWKGSTERSSRTHRIDETVDLGEVGVVARSRVNFNDVRTGLADV